MNGGPRRLVTTCPCCGTGELSDTFVAEEMQLGLRHRFSYASCATCGSLVLTDPPVELAPYYPSGYYSFQERARASRLRRAIGRLCSSTAVESTALPRLAGRVAVKVLGRPTWRSFIPCKLPSFDAHVLDVGCGSGELLELLWSEGFGRLHGIDPFLPEALARSASRPGLRFQVGQVQDLAPGEDGGFDLVMFHHSLEHVPDPLGDLSAARRLLGPNGKVLVRVPLSDGPGLQQFGAQWFGLDAPRHLVVPSRPGVAALAARAGLRVTASSDDSGGFLEGLSRLYQAGLPATTADGQLVRLEDHFSSDELAAFDERARLANAAAQGDMSAFLLEPTG